MSYMAPQSSFSAQSEIEDLGWRDLNLDEIDTVNGGIAPLVIAGIVVVAVIVIGFGACAISGYYANVKRPREISDN